MNFIKEQVVLLHSELIFKQFYLQFSEKYILKTKRYKLHHVNVPNTLPGLGIQQ
jgi:hypothetical protein